MTHRPCRLARFTCGLIHTLIRNQSAATKAPNAANPAAARQRSQVKKPTAAGFKPPIFFSATCGTAATTKIHTTTTAMAQMATRERPLARYKQKCTLPRLRYGSLRQSHHPVEKSSHPNLAHSSGTERTGWAV